MEEDILRNIIDRNYLWILAVLQIKWMDGVSFTDMGNIKKKYSFSRQSICGPGFPIWNYEVELQSSNQMKMGELDMQVGYGSWIWPYWRGWTQCYIFGIHQHAGHIFSDGTTCAESLKSEKGPGPSLEVLQHLDVILVLMNKMTPSVQTENKDQLWSIWNHFEERAFKFLVTSFGFQIFLSLEWKR